MRHNKYPIDGNYDGSLFSVAPNTQLGYRGAAVISGESGIDFWEKLDCLFIGEVRNNISGKQGTL